MLALVGLPRSTFLGWVKAGIIERDPGGAYTEPVVLELALIAALRDQLSIEELAIRWPRLRSQGKVADFVRRMRGVKARSGRYDVVIDVKTGTIEVATDAKQLVRAVRRARGVRTVAVIDLAGELSEVQEGFSEWAVTARRPERRRVGRPRARRDAPVTELHG